jgi:hypothetical protein
MSPSKQPREPVVCHYFVDEAGDGTIFARDGKIIIGTEGCSRYFMLGLLEIEAPSVLANELETLRMQILADPYFKRIPSLQPQQRKTALAFHAKDDLPEVRREVFRVIMTQKGLRFFAVVRDKRSVLDEFKAAGLRYHPNELYDKMVSRLFKVRLHKQDNYEITFAKRGKTDRTKALRAALENARERAKSSWGVQSTAPMTISAVDASSDPALQAADYLLWALQRLYERREDRYIDYVWPVYHLVHDVDDRRIKPYGVYYNTKNPIMLDKLKPL